MMGWSDPSFTHARYEQLVLRRWPMMGAEQRRPCREVVSDSGSADASFNGDVNPEDPLPALSSSVLDLTWALPLPTPMPRPPHSLSARLTVELHFPSHILFMHLPRPYLLGTQVDTSGLTLV